MKKIHTKIVIPALLFLLGFLLIGMSGCEKENTSTEPINITLYDKDSTTIQNYIQGKWEVVYATGGMTADYIHYFNDCTAEFTADKKHISSSPFGSDTTEYYWVKHAKYTGSSDSVYIMEPRSLYFEGIKNDTLVYSDAPMIMSEPMGYYLIKSKN
jgi:hypothetical protein